MEENTEEKPGQSPTPEENSRANLVAPFSSENQPKYNPGTPKGPRLSTITKQLMALKVTKQEEKDFREKHPEFPQDERVLRAHLYVARRDTIITTGEDADALRGIGDVEDRTEGKADQKLKISGDLGDLSDDELDRRAQELADRANRIAAGIATAPSDAPVL